MSLTVLAPVSGRVVPLADVPDPVFSAALVGPGSAIAPSGRGRTVAVAPVAGQIVKLHPHAYVIQTADGAGVLVHLGIDTVQLAGAGFELLVTEKAQVKAGEPIVVWDPVEIEAGGHSAICPVIALDGDPGSVATLAETDDIEAGGELLTWDR